MSESPLHGAHVVAFVTTADAPRARRFYEETLGLRVVSDDPFALVFDGNGTTIRVAKAKEIVVAPYTVLGFRVADVAATARALTARGVTFERYGFLEQDELGVWTAPGGTHVAWLKDADGHLLSLSSA